MTGARARADRGAPAAGIRQPVPTRARAIGRRSVALVGLAALALTCIGLAVPFAAPGSAVVLAAAERSPGWLLGPWQALGAEGADGELAGPLFYAGLWIALLSYVVVLAGSRAIGPRLAGGVIVALHLLFLLAPPLLSQDVFSYISYARLEVVHSLSPYAHSPDAVPGDAAYVFAGSKDATSVYGPLFTLATYPLAKLSVPAAFWTLKCIAALASLGVVALAAECARRLGRDPVFVALAVGINPLVLVHVVGGAHNDALMMLLVLAALLATLSVAGRERRAGVLAASASAVKVTAGLTLPFLVLGAKRKGLTIAGALAAAVVIVSASLVAFGLDAFDALGLVGENQERTSRWSLPQRSADGIGALTGASAGTAVDFTRAAFALAFVCALGRLLYRSWRAASGSHYWLEAAGWAMLGLLVASAWLVPWYAIWLLPLAALSTSRALQAGTLALCAYMLVIAVPL
jgi:alpha-1,6-mannosyltransferase